MGLSTPLLSQCCEEEKEDWYSTIDKNALEIIYKGKSVIYGEDFASVQSKWPDAQYSGVFDTVHDEYDENYFGICDYKMIFDSAYLYFADGKLAHFRIWSDQFKLRLKPAGENKETTILYVGGSARVMEKSFERTWKNFMEAPTGILNRIINVGRTCEEIDFHNDLIIKSTKSGKLTEFIHYGNH